MAKFRIQTEDGTFEVEADDEAHAAAALEQMSANNPQGKLAYGEVPEGMVSDPETGQMVDAKAIAEQKGGSWAGSFIKGMPFIGEYADELVGGGYPVKTEVARQMQEKFAHDNPKTAMAGQLATGATAIPALVMSGQALPTIGKGMVGATATGLGYGSTGGLLEGAVSGYGEGRTPEDRIAKAKERGAIGAVVGGGLGAVAPVVAAGIGKGARNVIDRFSVNREAAKLGVSRAAADAVTGAMRADDTLGVAGGRNMVRAGEDAMLADAGGTAQSMLDTAIQRSGTGGRIAANAVGERAALSSGRLGMTMDAVLGKPEGINKAARDISQASSKAREAAYKFAHSKPIDYASSAGRKVEDVFSRVPKSVLRSAIDEANDAMLAAGEKNMQILADIADDGSISFREMPNMRQADELKKALGSVAKNNVDQFGRPTAAGARASSLAKELRDALTEAVPAYKSALKLGGDKIAEDQALELGARLLSPSVTREAVREGVKGITDAERKQLGLGLRQHIDDAMANVTKAISDPNVDAREAAKALKDLSSRAAREKVTMAIGADKAKVLFRELEKAEASLNLKAATAQNSKTFARQSMDDAVKATRGGVIDAVKEGRPMEAPRRLWQQLTGATDQAKRAEDDKLYAEIAQILTGPRGPDAMRALQSLMKIYQTGAGNQALARSVGNGAAAALALPAYQKGTQSAEGLSRRQPLK